MLQEAGWATAGFYTWKYLDDTFGFGPGFDSWERHGHDFFSHPEIGAEFLRLKQAEDLEGMKALAAQHPDLLDPARVTSPETIERAKNWLSDHLAQDAAQPFFLFVHLFDVHDPTCHRKASIASAIRTTVDRSMVAASLHPTHRCAATCPLRTWSA